MLAGGHPEVRYNAATGLARHGHPKAADVLVEMLELNARAGVDVEKQEVDKAPNRTIVVVNALEASRQLLAVNRSDDMSRLVKAIEQLSHDKVHPQIHVKAMEVLKR